MAAFGDSLPERAARILGVIVIVGFLLFCLLPSLVQCGVIRIP